MIPLLLLHVTEALTRTNHNQVSYSKHESQLEQCTKARHALNMLFKKNKNNLNVSLE